MLQENDFLEQYMFKLFKDSGLDNLTEEQKKVHEPKIRALIQERVIIELLPSLDKENLNQLTSMAGKKNTPMDDWKEFWLSAVPDFAEKMENILNDISKEIQESLN